MSITYRALDSGLVHLEAQSGLGPASSQVVARSRQRRVSALSLASAAAGFAEGLALQPELGRDVALVHELELQGGWLRIWSGLQPIEADGLEYVDVEADGTRHPAPVHFAGWTAGGYDLLVTRYSGQAEDFFTLLDDFALSATPEGLACVPLDRRMFWFVQPASVIVDVPGVGVLEVFERVGNKARSVPRHRGTSVAGGELFVGQRGSDHQWFLHVGDSTVSYMSPHDHHEPQAALDLLSGLRVTWAR